MKNGEVLSFQLQHVLGPKKYYFSSGRNNEGVKTTYIHSYTMKKD